MVLGSPSHSLPLTNSIEMLWTSSTPSPNGHDSTQTESVCWDVPVRDRVLADRDVERGECRVNTVADSFPVIFRFCARNFASPQDKS